MPTDKPKTLTLDDFLNLEAKRLRAQLKALPEYRGAYRTGYVEDGREEYPKERSLQEWQNSLDHWRSSVELFE